MGNPDTWPRPGQVARGQLHHPRLLMTSRTIAALIELQTVQMRVNYKVSAQVKGYIISDSHIFNSHPPSLFIL